MKLVKTILFVFITLFFIQTVSAKQPQKNLKSNSRSTRRSLKKRRPSAKKAMPKVAANANIANLENATSIPECAKHPKIIRVLIDEKKIENWTNFSIKSSDGFVLESPSGSKIAAAFDTKIVELMIKESKLYLKCEDGKFRHIKKDDIEIYPAKGHLTLNGKSYQGSLNFRINLFSRSILIINKLDLEDYVSSVLCSEIVPSWSLEVHKVQAIATRTYALYHMKQARQKNSYSFYDLRNSNINQIYEGVHKFKCFHEATEQTKGLVLTYNGQIALAMFDICCGGVIPANMRKNKKSPPYLKRTQPCNFCSRTAFYRNHLTYKNQDFVERLKANPNLKRKMEGFGNKLVDIQIIDKDSAGVVHKVRLAGKKYVTLTCSELLSSFKNKIKSSAFSIKKHDNKITLIFKGYSHYNGLCQWGAKGLVDRGWDYKKVLNFYFPGTILSKLKA